MCFRDFAVYWGYMRNDARRKSRRPPVLPRAPFPWKSTTVRQFRPDALNSIPQTSSASISHVPTNFEQQPNHRLALSRANCPSRNGLLSSNWGFSIRVASLVAAAVAAADAAVQRRWKAQAKAMGLHSAWPKKCGAKSGHAEPLVARGRPFLQKALKTSRLRPSPGYVTRPFYTQRTARLAHAELAARRPHRGSVYAAETFERRMPKKVSRCCVEHDNSGTAQPIKILEGGAKLQLLWDAERVAALRV